MINKVVSPLGWFIVCGGLTHVAGASLLNSVLVGCLVAGLEILLCIVMRKKRK